MPPPGDPQVRLDVGNGRSVYISKTLDAVINARKKNRAVKMLRAKLPNSVFDELERRAKEACRPWHITGLWHCDVYGVEGTQAAIDDVMDCDSMGSIHPDGGAWCGVW